MAGLIWLWQQPTGPEPTTAPPGALILLRPPRKAEPRPRRTRVAVRAWAVGAPPVCTATCRSVSRQLALCATAADTAAICVRLRSVAGAAAPAAADGLALAARLRRAVVRPPGAAQLDGDDDAVVALLWNL